MSRFLCIILTLVAFAWAPFGCDLDTPEKDTTSQDTVQPEDTVVPPEDSIVPPEDSVVPPEDTIVPPEDTVIPPEDTVIPPEDTVIPSEDTIVPPEDSVDPPPDVIQPPDCIEDCKPPDPDGDQALCAETGGTWTNCGSGCGPWACGTPFPEICPAVCISQCNCPDGDGWDPQKGCVTCTCDEWFVTWAALLAQVQSCQSPDDCIDVPGTSCGCTMNYVVNKSASLWLFWQIGELMGAAGCGPFGSTCSCPPVDGFKCENGVCGWNYL